jgi:hypothetical protein
LAAQRYDDAAAPIAIGKSRLCFEMAHASRAGWKLDATMERPFDASFAAFDHIVTPEAEDRPCDADRDTPSSGDIECQHAWAIGGGGGDNCEGIIIDDVTSGEHLAVCR